jgi:hypothetical protein
VAADPIGEGQNLENRIEHGTQKQRLHFLAVSGIENQNLDAGRC